MSSVIEVDKYTTLVSEHQGQTYQQLFTPPDTAVQITIATTYQSKANIE